MTIGWQKITISFKQSFYCSRSIIIPHHPDWPLLQPSCHPYAPPIDMISQFKNCWKSKTSLFLLKGCTRVSHKINKKTDISPSKARTFAGFPVALLACKTWSFRKGANFFSRRIRQDCQLQTPISQLLWQLEARYYCHTIRLDRSFATACRRKSRNAW